MEEKLRETTEIKLIEKLHKKFVHPLLWVAYISFALIIASPFTWIWIGWWIAWRLFLSGIFGVIVYIFINKIMKMSINKSVDDLTDDELIHANEHLK